MPKYRIETNRGTFEVEANREPTAAEVEAMIAGGTQPQAKPEPAAGPIARAPSPTMAGFMANPMANPAVLSGVSSPDRGAAGAAVDTVLEGGLPAAGQALGAMTGPAAPVAVPALGFLGGAGGNALAQTRRMAVGDQNRFLPGQMLANGVSGAIPGANLIKAPAKTIAWQAAKDAGAAVGSGVIQAGVDDKRMLTPKEVAALALLGGGSTILSKTTAADAKEIAKTVKQQTWERLAAAGYKVTPTVLDPSPINQLLLAAGGKELTPDVIARANQVVSNELAAKALGRHGSRDVSSDLIDEVRKQAAGPYQEVAALSAEAASKLEKLKQLRAEATLFYQHYSVQKLPSSLKKAESLKAEANAIESDLESIAKSTGNEDLMKRFRAARIVIAKSYDVESALNPDNGNIAAGVLHRIQKKDGKLTDELATIASAYGFNRKMVREPSTMADPGGGKLKAGLSLILGGGGYAQGGIPAAIAGAAIPFSDFLPRAISTSDAYQRYLTNRFLGNQTRAQFVPSMLRVGAQAEGRNRFLEK